MRVVANMPPVVAQAIAGGIGLLLLLLIWRLTAGLPRLARLFGRLGLALIVVGPIALFLWQGHLPSERAEVPRPPVSTQQEGERQRAAHDASEATVPAAREEREPSAAAPQTPAATSPQPFAAGTEIATQKTERDLVPVFYGTDRALDTEAERTDYTWQRGAKLQLGRALIRVPAAHQAAQSVRPWAVTVPYVQVAVPGDTEAADDFFIVEEVKPLEREDFLAAVRERRERAQRFKDKAIVFIHGYNTSFAHAAFRAAQLAYDLEFDGVPFLYSWPSGGDVPSYTYDRDSAAQAAPHLRAFLELVVKDSGAKSVSIIAHNMGSQPLLEVIREVKDAAPAGVVIDQLILTAPDVDRASFTRLAGIVRTLANGVTVYAAGKDRALMVSRRFHGGVPQAGDVTEAGPLLLPGIDTIDATAWSMDELGLNTAAYAKKHALLGDIGTLIATGERPPGKREPALEHVETGKGEYWRYPAGK